jgi:putative transposase
MARPLRIDIPGGRYHVTSRGNERRAIFRQDRDRMRFLELLSELPARFGLHVHAYVLMDNHYHLVVETPEANLSRAAQWLNVSYSVWFNRRHRRAGHLFQGRFKAILIEEDIGLQRVGRYVHLNPVRLMSLGLGKNRRQALAKGLAEVPKAEVVRQRVEVLRKYRWSSYGAVAGYRAAAGWLGVKHLRQLCGGRGEADQVRAVRQYTEAEVREGLSENPWEGLVGGAILGSEDFAQRLLKRIKRDEREEPAAARTARRVSWEQIVQAVEKAKGQRWEAFCQKHGDWGRDAALWLGRHTGRMRLAEMAAVVEHCDYTTVAKAVSRFSKRLVQDSRLARRFQKIHDELSKI